MTVKDLLTELNLSILSGGEGLEKEIDGGYVSDLLSDVMGNAEMGNAWITLQTHKNIIAIASLKELACIILVQGFTPDAETLKKSEEEGIPILSSTEETFQVAGKLYAVLQKNA